jgi:hypothetical protein
VEKWLGLRLESDNYMDLKESGCAGAQLIYLHKVRCQWLKLVNMVRNAFGSIKCRKFLEYCADYYLFKKDFTPWNYA